MTKQAYNRITIAGTNILLDKEHGAQSENFVVPYKATNIHRLFLVHVNLNLVGISPLQAAA